MCIPRAALWTDLRMALVYSRAPEFVYGTMEPPVSGGNKIIPLVSGIFLIECLLHLLIAFLMTTETKIDKTFETVRILIRSLGVGFQFFLTFCSNFFFFFITIHIFHEQFVSSYLNKWQKRVNAQRKSELIVIGNVIKWDIFNDFLKWLFKNPT